ncbi:hypothetical protein LR48_Vigan10g082200 [Vigna angularis]|uniref:Uncharacterized protein n=1 Tax=Phaseolus angularis TaxID=3914 RepID=A0A0L9VIN8_PHAAN|nr:hypothetical protein LR48_Vigan10g082200 [Vigna angularis]
MGGQSKRGGGTSLEELGKELVEKKGKPEREEETIGKELQEPPYRLPTSSSSLLSHPTSISSPLCPLLLVTAHPPYLLIHSQLHHFHIQHPRPLLTPYGHYLSSPIIIYPNHQSACNPFIRAIRIPGFPSPHENTSILGSSYLSSLHRTYKEKSQNQYHTHHARTEERERNQKQLAAVCLEEAAARTAPTGVNGIADSGPGSA